MKNAIVLKSLILLASLVISLSTLLSHSMAAIDSEAPPMVVAGPDAAALFGAKCAICHDKDGRGQQKWKAKGQPDFTDTNWQMSRAVLGCLPSSVLCTSQI